MKNIILNKIIRDMDTLVEQSIEYYNQDEYSKLCIVDNLIYRLENELRKINFVGISSAVLDNLWEKTWDETVYHPNKLCRMYNHAVLYANKIDKLLE